MKVLFVSHAYQIPENQEKLAALAGAGVTLGLLAPEVWHDPGMFGGRPFPLARNLNQVSYLSARIWRSGHVASHLFVPGTIRKAVAAFSPDIVHVEQEIYGYTTAQTCLEVGPRQRVTVFTWENLDRKIHFTQHFARKISVRRVDGIISGNVTGKHLLRKWGFGGPVEVIPQFGIYSAFLDEAGRRGRDRDSPMIGFVGRFAHEKGGDLLLHALAMLARQGRDFRARFLGAGPEKMRWQEIARNAGIADRIEWIDAVPHGEVPPLMSDMGVLVLPSRTVKNWAEQFGQVLVQAMALGIPVIGARSGAIPEVIGRKDLIFPENDSAELARILKNVIDNAEYRKELEIYGVERVRDNYTFEQISSRICKFWEKLL